MSVQVKDIQLLEPADEIAAFAIDTPAPGTVEEGHNLTVSGWALTPTGPPRLIRVTLVSTSRVLDGPVARIRPLIRRPDTAQRFSDITDADECGFLTSFSLVGFPQELELLVSAELADGRHARLAVLRVWRDVIEIGPWGGLDPVIVHMPARSGSTWLTRLLGQHPQGLTFRPFQHEPRVAAYWMEVFKSLAGPTGYSRAIDPGTGEPDWWIAERDWLPLVGLGDDPGLRRWLTADAVEELARSCRGMIEGFYRSLARQEGKEQASFFAERTISPRVTAMIREFYRGAAEVLMVRDPRDILASRLAFMVKTGVQQFGRGATGSDEEYVRNEFAPEIRLFAVQWEDARDRALRLKYEDLVQRPEDTLRSIFEHLEVDSAAETIAQVLGAAEQMTPERQRRHMTVTDAQASIGRWRSALDESLVVACEDALGDALNRLGYA